MENNINNDSTNENKNTLLNVNETASIEAIIPESDESVSEEDLYKVETLRKSRRSWFDSDLPHSRNSVQFLIDTGATAAFINDESLFTSYNNIKPIKVRGVGQTFVTKKDMVKRIVKKLPWELQSC